jgi:CheY-like chemotaxis protein
MPVLDGIESAKKIRSFEKESGTTPACIIALTANETSEFAGKYLEAGMDGVIEKPLKIEQIKDYLNQMKNRRAFQE